MKIAIILAVFIFFSPIVSIGQNKIDKKQISGDWQKNCNGESGRISIFPNIDTAVIEVNSNQIVIMTKCRQLEANNHIIVYFKLIKPIDLGEGGMGLSWKDFSKDSVIAKMEITGTSQAKITWYGFYNKQLKKRVWTNGFDILSGNGNNQALIKKCNDFIRG